MYSVYYWKGDEEILHGTTKHFGNADRTAQELSLGDGISEAFVYDENMTLLRVYVNGNEVDVANYLPDDYDEDQDPWVPYDYDDVDECGYNPYIGCYDDDC